MLFRSESHGLSGFQQQLWILNIQKTLIQLDFGNPEPHNKVLAWRHPNMG
jgi:hypothetical protein